MENTNIRIIQADVYARVEYNAHIEIEVSDQATEEDIQRELDEAAQLAVSEHLQTYQGLQPEITITRLEEEEVGEKGPEQMFPDASGNHFLVPVPLRSLEASATEIGKIRRELRIVGERHLNRRVRCVPLSRPILILADLFY